MKIMIAPTTKMPRISDRDLMRWYDLKKSEVKEFKEMSGHNFMVNQLELVNDDNLKYYMQLVFSQKKHLELFLAETDDINMAFELFVAPFVFQATILIKKMAQEYHDYAAWYTDKQLKLSNWIDRKTFDEVLTHTGAFQETN